LVNNNDGAPIEGTLVFFVYIRMHLQIMRVHEEKAFVMIHE